MNKNGKVVTPQSVVIINDGMPHTPGGMPHTPGGTYVQTVHTPLTAVTPVEQAASRRMSNMPRINESSGKDLSAHAESKADIDEDEE